MAGSAVAGGGYANPELDEDALCVTMVAIIRTVNNRSGIGHKVLNNAVL